MDDVSSVAFLSQSQKSGRGLRLWVFLNFRFMRDMIHLSREEGKVTLQGRLRAGLLQNCCRGIQGYHNYSSGITLFSSQTGSLYSSQTEYFCSFQSDTVLLQPTFPQVFPFSTMAVSPAQIPCLILLIQERRCATCAGAFVLRSVYLQEWPAYSLSITVSSPSLICQLQHRGSFLTPSNSSVGAHCRCSKYSSKVSGSSYCYGSTHFIKLSFINAFNSLPVFAICLKI